MKDDFFAIVRSTMMTKMQKSLSEIISQMEMNEKQLAEILGVPESIIQELEMEQDEMTELQYVALCGLIDNKMHDNPILAEYIKRLFDVEGEEEISLLSRWMLAFEEEEEVEAADIKDGQIIDERAMELLAESYKVFLSYDSLKLCKNNSKFFELLKEMKARQNAFIVPIRAVDKLQNDMFSVRASKDARRALSLLNRLKDNNDIVLKGDEDDGTVEEVILNVFKTFKNRYQLALFTENEELARALQHMNKETDGADIKVITLQNQEMRVYDALVEEEIEEANDVKAKETVNFILDEEKTFKQTFRADDDLSTLLSSDGGNNPISDEDDDLNAIINGEDELDAISNTEDDKLALIPDDEDEQVDDDLKQILSLNDDLDDDLDEVETEDNVFPVMPELNSDSQEESSKVAGKDDVLAGINLKQLDLDILRVDDDDEGEDGTDDTAPSMDWPNIW